MLTQHDLDILFGGKDIEGMKSEINHMIYMIGHEIAYSNGLLSQYYLKTENDQKIYSASSADI